MLSFDGYFHATEGAFVEEKEVMLDRIHQLSGSWDEASKLDESASKLCDELQTLKTVLSKGHLQILRTREETLRLELANCERSFRVRQLHSEIWRFLPHATSTVATVDYELAVAPPSSSSAAPPDANHVPPDAKLAREFAALRDRWEALLRSQAAVFDEELQHRECDNAHFARFAADFTEQNAAAHATINATMKRIIARIVHEKQTSDGTARAHRARIDAIARREQQLAAKDGAIREGAARRALDERERIQRGAARESRAVRARVRRLEQGNLRRAAALQQRSAEMHREHRARLDRLHALRREERRLLGARAREAGRWESRVDALEAKMSAIVSSAAAVREVPERQHRDLLRMVAAAVGEHGKVAQSVEQVNAQLMKLRQTRRRLGGGSR